MTGKLTLSCWIVSLWRSERIPILLYSGLHRPSARQQRSQKTAGVRSGTGRHYLQAEIYQTLTDYDDRDVKRRYLKQIRQEVALDITRRVTRPRLPMAYSLLARVSVGQSPRVRLQSQVFGSGRAISYEVAYSIRGCSETGVVLKGSGVNPLVDRFAQKFQQACLRRRLVVP